MRYRHYRRYSGYHSKPKFYFSEEEIDFTTERIDYDQFLLQEFFTAKSEAQKKIYAKYAELYGIQSLAYLRRKYLTWKDGDFHLTDLIRDRILLLMPVLLDERAKHKLGIHEFMSSIKNTVRTCLSNQKNIHKSSINLRNPQQLVNVFGKELERIKALSLVTPRFDVLTSEERQEALEICKYILETKLQTLFDQVEHDVRVFLPYLIQPGRGSFLASYFIDAFNLKTEITNKQPWDFASLNFEIAEIEANSRFKAFADKYVAYELISIHSEKNKAFSNAFLNKNDLEMFFNKFWELSLGEAEVRMNSFFQGEGGTLSIQAQLKPKKLLVSALLTSAAKLFVYAIVIASLIGLFRIMGRSLAILFFFGAIFLVGFFLSLIEELKQFKNLAKELRGYGKQ